MSVPGAEARLFAGLRSYGSPIDLCELAPGAKRPGYRARQRLRSAIRRMRREGGTSSASSAAALRPTEVVLFTDASHERLVLTWRQPSAGGFVRYVEQSCDPTGMTLGALRSLDSFQAAFQPGSRSGERGTWSLRSPELLAWLAGTSAPAHRRISGLASWCRDRATLSDLEELWKRFWKMRVIDPNMASGDWLVGAGRVLEVIPLAILDRLRSFLIDCGTGKPRQCASSASNLLRTDEQVAEPARAEWYIRRRLAAEVLFGWSRSRAEIRECRRRLRGFARLPAAGGPWPLNIRFRPVVGAEPDAPPASGYYAGGIRAEDLREEDRALRMSRAAAIAAGLHGGNSAVDRKFAAEWERRRRTALGMLRPRDGLGAVRIPGIEPDLRFEGLGLWSNDDFLFVRGGV